MVGKTGPRVERNDLDAKIPKLQITFLDTEADTWHINRSMRSTFGVFHDLDVLVAPFGYLFNVQQIEFSFPEVLTHEFGRLDGNTVPKFVAQRYHIARFLKLCQYVRQQALSSHLFQLDWIGPTQFFFESDIDRYLFLDKALDTAPGPSAAILRRERLIHHQSYRKTLQRILEMHCKDGDEYNEAAEVRFRDFGYLDRSYQDHGRKLYKAQDSNWLEEWRRYWPTGIPPKGSPEWDACIATARR